MFNVYCTVLTPSQYSAMTETSGCLAISWRCYALILLILVSVILVLVVYILVTVWQPPGDNIPPGADHYLEDYTDNQYPGSIDLAY